MALQRHLVAGPALVWGYSVKMMIRIGCLLFMALGCILPAARAQQKPKLTEAAAMRRDIHREVNQKRRIYNQAPLKLNDVLSRIAQAHSQAMADGKVPLGHDGFHARDSAINAQWANAHGTGENVTIAADAEEAVESWWTSEGHKDNMLGAYSDTGIGVVKVGGMWYCTQIFVCR